MGKSQREKETGNRKEAGSAGRENREKAGKNQSVHKDKTVLLCYASDDEEWLE